MSEQRNLDASQPRYRRSKLHTDLGNSRRLVARHGKNIRYVPEWKKWMIWRDERWNVDSDGEIMRLAKDTVEALYAEAMGLNSADRDALLGHAIKSQSEARLRAMVNLAETEAAVVLSADQLVQTRGCSACRTVSLTCAPRSSDPH